jgi:hypothetical protein
MTDLVACNTRQSLLLLDDQHEVDTLRWLGRVADQDEWK